MTTHRDVYICETGPRDGLQNLSLVLPTAAKCELIDLIAAAGVPEIEVGSFVPPKVVPQFADISAVVAHAKRHEAAAIISTLIPNLRGAENALAAGVTTLNFVISASEGHNRANVRRTIEEQIAGFKAVVALRNAQPNAAGITLLGAVSTSFGCSIEGHVSEAAVRRVALAYAEAGADEIALADTVGYGYPGLIKSIVKAVRADVGPKVGLRLHLHDTLGTGLANAVAGLEAGITRFDSSVSGLGGCPFAPGARGNIVTEDLIYLCERMGLATGVDLQGLMATRALLGRHIPASQLSGHVHEAGLPKVYGRAA
jgi:hydroxymethylglutaryl-CoA lyase